LDSLRCGGFRRVCRRPAEERFHTALDERSKPCPSVLVCGGRRPWIHSCDTTRHPRVACDAGQPTRACLVKLSTLRYARGSTPPSSWERLSTDPDGRPTPSATKVLRHSESNGYLRAYCEKPGITPPGGRPVFGTATARPSLTVWEPGLPLLARRIAWHSVAPFRRPGSANPYSSVEPPTLELHGGTEVPLVSR
jgi:hypothetical protein